MYSHHMNFDLTAIVSIVTAVFATASVVTVVALRHAPEGVETEEGFCYLPSTANANESSDKVSHHHFDASEPHSHSEAA
jgi:hypothetical protein